jgi:hypothetical protein
MVCKGWQDVHDGLVFSLSVRNFPKAGKKCFQTLRTRFRRVKDLTIANFPNHGLSASTRDLPSTSNCNASYLSLEVDVFHELASLTSLTTIHLADQRLPSLNVTEEGLGALSLLTDLTTLVLIGFEVKPAEGLKKLALLTALNTLCLSKCSSLTDDHLRAVAKLTTLTKLTINMFSVKLGDLRSLTTLPTHSLTAHVHSRYVTQVWNVTGEGVRALAALTDLKHLDLHGLRGVTDDGVNALAGLSTLTYLSLFNSRKVTDGGVRALACLTALTYLDLGFTKVTDRGLVELVPALPFLRNLRLMNCRNVASTPLIMKLGHHCQTRSMPPEVKHEFDVHYGTDHDAVTGEVLYDLDTEWLREYEEYGTGDDDDSDHSANSEAGRTPLSTCDWFLLQVYSPSPFCIGSCCR